MAQYGERRRSLLRAEESARKTFQMLGVDVDLTPMLGGSPGVWRCVLNRDGSRVTQGMGKGSELAAKVGAMYEALEHYFIQPDVLPRQDIVLKSSHEVASSLKADMGAALLEQFPNSDIACLPCTSIVDGSELMVPVFLSMPTYIDEAAAPYRAVIGDHFDYGHCPASRYSVNNGWASGADVTEASVHAINELIERDALSITLVDQFLTGRPAPLRIFDPDSLSPRLGSLLRFARDLLGREIHLLDITTDLGVPTCLVYVPGPRMNSQIRGAGTSLSRSYAIERALTELIQAYRVFEVMAPPDTAPPRHPGLRECYFSDYSARLRDAEYTTFEETDVPDSPDGHLEQLISVLTSAGLQIYRYIRFQDQDAAALTILIPGLERFFLVTDGISVVPGGRAMHLTAAR